MPTGTDTAPDIDALVRPDRIAGRLYLDPAVFEFELDRIWHVTWVYVGHESEVPNPGDYVTRRIGRHPVILSRDGDGHVHVLLNRCPHRGSSICRLDTGNVGRLFQCAYHGWTFELDGTLKGATLPQRFGSSFDKASWSMKDVARVDSYRGFVFASLSPSGEPLVEHLGEAASYIDHFVDMAPDGDVELSAGVIRHGIDANWKMVFENSSDGYHALFLHRSCVEEFRSENMDHARALGSQPTVFARDLGNGHAMLDFSEQNAVSGSALDFNKGRLDAETVARYRADLVRARGARRAEELLSKGLSTMTVFPNLAFVFQDVRIFVPLSAHRSEEHHFPALLRGAPSAINRARIRANVISYGGAGFLGAEDAEIYERLQSGLETQTDDWVNLSRGLEQERMEGSVLVGDASDETSLRAFWKRYRRMMLDDGRS